MRAVLASAALFLSAPSLAQSADLYTQGVEARLSGQNGRAAELLGQLARAEPANADAQLQYGLALLALNRLDEAEVALKRTLELAPGYTDARIGLARVEQRRGQRERAIAMLEPVGASNAEAVSLRRQLTGGEAAEWGWTRLDVDGTYSFVNQGQRDWKEASARLTHQASPRTTVSGGVELASRFGRTDAYGEGRIDQRLGGGASGYAFVGATPNADFRPQWQVGLGGAVPVIRGPNPTVLTLDAAHAKYRPGAVQTLTPGVDQYLAEGKAWVSLRWINIFHSKDRHESGWLARGDVMATPKLRLFVGAADAPDTTEGIVTDTFAVFGGASYDINDRISLRASMAHEERESGAKRLQVGIGAGVRF